MRREMKAWARERYSWRRSARLWKAAFEQAEERLARKQDSGGAGKVRDGGEEQQNCLEEVRQLREALGEKEHLITTLRAKIERLQHSLH